MSELLIRKLAKELAGEFYEQKRSGRFRSMDSLTRAKTLKQLPDGTVVELPVTVKFREAYPTAKVFSTAHWPFFYDTARRCLTTMLALSDARISPHMKETIYAALLADREKQDKVGGRRLIQGSVR